MFRGETKEPKIREGQNTRRYGVKVASSIRGGPVFLKCHITRVLMFDVLRADPCEAISRKIAFDLSGGEGATRFALALQFWHKADPVPSSHVHVTDHIASMMNL